MLNTSRHSRVDRLTGALYGALLGEIAEDAQDRTAEIDSRSQPLHTFEQRLGSVKVRRRQPILTCRRVEPQAVEGVGQPIGEERHATLFECEKVLEGRVMLSQSS
jgi:hypothetical protein